MPGETLPGDLIILGGQVEIADGARVGGALVVVSGNVTAAGAVEGDISLFNGTLTLGQSLHAGGALNVGGGVLHRSPGATVLGPVRTGGDVQLPNLARTAEPSLAEETWRSISSTLLLALIAYALVRLIPRPATRVARAAAEEPLVAGAMGALVVIVIPSLLVLMAFTVLLIPATLLGGLLLVAAAVYGWVGLGLATGRWLTARLHREARPTASAVIGTSLITLLVNALGTLPLLGAVVTTVALAVALGAVVLTAFGTRLFVPADSGEAV